MNQILLIILIFIQNIMIDRYNNHKCYIHNNNKEQYHRIKQILCIYRIIFID